MSTLSCREIEAEIELYAAGEGAAPSSAVEQHLATCPACARAYEEAQQLLGLLDMHFQQAARIERMQSQWKAEEHRKRTRVLGRPLLRFAAAVAALVLLVLGLAYWAGKKLNVEKGSPASPALGPYVTLPDGTVVLASSGTSWKELAPRQLDLTAGELYVEVAPAAEPFTIKTPAGLALARGTAFFIDVRQTSPALPKGEKHVNVAKRIVLVTVLSGLVTLSNLGHSVTGSRGEALFADEQATPKKIDSEAAIAAGLKWLEVHQAADGHWSPDSFHKDGKCNCTGQGKADDISGTAIALLPFLGAGQTHQKGRYAKVIDQGLKYLIGKQNAAGDFSGGMVAQGLATLALCEVYSLTSDQPLKGPAQRAVNFIIKAQEDSGGWNAGQGKKADVSIVSWQVMALKSAQMAGLDVPVKSLGKVHLFLDSVASADKGRYGLNGPPGPRPNDNPAEFTSAAGLSCRRFLGWRPTMPELEGGVKELMKNLPSPTVKDIYFYYFATQVMQDFGGENWKEWSPKIRDLLVETQDRGTDNPHQKGSWSPEGDAHAAEGGRLMVTALSVLTLEFYYRHLPLMRQQKLQ